MKTRSKPPIRRAEIRRLAVRLTIMLWIYSIVLMVLFYGRSLPRSAAVAGVVALGGLLEWWCYHLLSRRNDGLMVFISASLVAGLGGSGARRDGMPLVDELALVSVVLASQALFIAVFGWFVRERPETKGPQSPDPLWDAHVDPPVSG